MSIEKTLTLHNVIILIKSVLNKNKSHYFFHRIIMVRFGEKKIRKRKNHAAKRPIKIWNVNVDNILISKLIDTSI